MNHLLLIVLLGTGLVGLSSSLVGSFSYVRKNALIGDAVAHALLPGICLGYLLVMDKSLPFLFLGALISGTISVIAVEFIQKNTVIKEDSAIAIVLSVFFGFGVVMLTYIQNLSLGNQSGLDQFLFGNAASLVEDDILWYFILTAFLMTAVLAFFKEFKTMCFDRTFALSSGMPVKFLEALLTLLTVLAVIIGIQTVGVVLMAAMLVTPVAAARYWTQNFGKMTFFACLFSLASCLFGSLVSFYFEGMPTGPWIVTFASLFAFISFFIAPDRGIISQWSFKRRINESAKLENLIKTLYVMESEKGINPPFSIAKIASFRPDVADSMSKRLKKLINDGLIHQENSHYRLNAAGKIKGKRLVKLHRLWELYLSEYLDIAEDHVHEDAESMEHILTPEIEARLEKVLNYPEQDPHKSKIPY